MNELLERCAGMDVHKNSIVACVIIGSGKSVIKEIRTFKTTTSELNKLAAWLRSHNIKEIAMESTGVYWKCAYNVMEKDFRITLTNPRHMKNIPGKKTDVKDAEWVCTLLKHGLLQASFIPPKKNRNLRDLTRLRKKHTQSKTSASNRIIKFLESANVKLKSIVSNVGGVASWNIIKAISSGITDPNELAALAITNLRATSEEIVDALTGMLSEHDIYMVKCAVKEVEFYDGEIQSIDAQIKIAEHDFKEPLRILRTFPGIGETSGVGILAEIGTNMSQFPTEHHLASWAGLVPGNNESAGKVMSTRINKGNYYLKTMLLQVTWAAIREKNGHWNSVYYRLKPRLGARKAAIAIARRILTTIYMALSLGINYEDIKFKGDLERVRRSIEYYKKKLEDLTAITAPAA